MNQLFIQKHEAFHAMREVVEGKPMTEPDWIILRLLVASCRTQAVTHPDYVRSTLHLLKKYGSKGLYEGIDRLHAEGRR
jgi:hypothetical protein